MNFNRSLVLFVIMFVSFTLSACTTTFTMSSINTPNGPLQAQGDVTVVERKTAETFQSAMSADMAKHQERLAKIQARVEIARAEAQADAEKAKARAENPCSSWFMAPSFCYGYSGGGVGYYPGGPGGGNTTFHSGGSGGYTHPSRRPGGTNGSFGGGTSPGGNTGGNTGGAH